MSGWLVVVGLSRQVQVPKSYWRQPPTKEAVGKLLDACRSPGAKLAVALAVHSGLKTGQVRELVFSDLVEFSTASKQFSQIPSRINLRNQVTGRKYYTFLSTAACWWLLEDLKTRTQPVKAESTVVGPAALRETEKAIHAMGLRWHDLRDFFAESFIRCFATMGTGSVDLHFLLGHSIDENVLTHVWRFFDPKRIEWMRGRYVRVEKQFFA